MPPVTIPQFLLPRGAPSPLSLRALNRRTTYRITSSTTQRCASSTPDDSKPRVLSKPDKFRPPSHPARRVVQTRNGKVVNSGPINYPGPKLSEKEKEEQKHRQYPNMFPPEGTVMHKFLTNRWIHIWIAMGVLTSLATFTFTTNFKHSSPFAHLLPPWSALLSHPIDTVRQAISVFRMHVQHNSIETREKRRRRVDDAEKRRQYRVAHGLEEPNEKDLAGADGKEVAVDDQSPVAKEQQGEDDKNVYVDWEGNKRPVKKWLGIW
ncbi:hypothetical protein AAWM_01701 [Aspergillus awamori]|uniref:Uncharacterized protein n=4 Tax=Aspergillus TaxID=5052 RepID=A0A3F3PZ72_9EURO|nr:hypothetical protein ANI_1_252024 [Aspergillus niger CBS 513.88]XP_025460320.1 uncharacterized protein BO96DRAFT_406960 [Aspergillus niger CBS 101883]XP_026625261.1 hypothetical protein BDQ94DRAFT_145690 [Aspergillus welwitschiae]RDH25092.1 hypothetical protein M747DRAFT_366427 [Aspergillus niger ATCC 13496]RDK42009.1 hypothetical protein M752DRAFT_336385 [Aspergillus phoenicis ATCC 13157]GCB18816.1 hypothetical protein AAWM_01701 [Aspergillus awamori]GJP91018.1 hypothetical protein AlacWU|eukprot:XP_001399327.2 hypothetical protein ANI_1_252024 [Aspergillus niger CBS 513.88]